MECDHLPPKRHGNLIFRNSDEWKVSFRWNPKGVQLLNNLTPVKSAYFFSNAWSCYCYSWSHRLSSWMHLNWYCCWKHDGEFDECRRLFGRWNGCRVRATIGWNSLRHCYGWKHACCWRYCNCRYGSRNRCRDSHSCGWCWRCCWLFPLVTCRVFVGTESVFHSDPFSVLLHATLQSVL